MPFVGTERGKQLYNQQIKPEQVGDLCAIAYTPIIRAWRHEPRWTTVHKVIKPMLPAIENDLRSRIQRGSLPFTMADAKIATELAYEVFFGIYVIKYEKDKKKENGDIE